MDTSKHDIEELFIALGIPHSETAIEAFIKNNHLPPDIPLEQAAVWNAGQAQFIHEAVEDHTDWEEVVNQLEVWSDEIEAQFTPLIIEVMVSLDDEQIADIPKKLNAANAEFAEEEADLSLDEAQALWAEEFAESMDNLVGKLTSEQLAFLQRKRAEYQPERVLWADYRSRWQADLLALLAERDAAEFPERYRALVAAREGYYGEELTAIFDNNERLNRETGAYLMSNLTDKQTQRFVKFLSDLSETFSELAQEA